MAELNTLGLRPQRSVNMFGNVPPIRHTVYVCSRFEVHNCVKANRLFHNHDKTHISEGTLSNRNTPQPQYPKPAKIPEPRQKYVDIERVGPHRFRTPAKGCIYHGRFRDTNEMLVQTVSETRGRHFLPDHFRNTQSDLGLSHHNVPKALVFRNTQSDPSLSHHNVPKALVTKLAC